MCILCGYDYQVIYSMAFSDTDLESNKENNEKHIVRYHFDANTDNYIQVYQIRIWIKQKNGHLFPPLATRDALR